MRKYQTSLSALAIGAVLSSTLVLGGCGNKEGASASKTISKVKTRKISAEQSAQALTALSLSESGAGDVTWTSRDGSNGNYTFTDVKFNDGDDKALHVNTMTLRGAHMQDEQAAFDQIVLNGISAGDDETKVALKNFTLNEPSPTLSNAFAKAFSGDDSAFENMEGDIGFSAISFTGLTVEGDDAQLSLASVSMDKANGSDGVFSLKDFKMNVDEKKDKIKINLGSIDVTGLNVEKYKTLFSAAQGGGEDAMKNIMASMNPYNPDFKNYSLKNLAVDANGVLINLDSLSGKAEQKGSKIIMTQKMTPLTIVPPTTSTDRGAMKFAEAMDTLGYKKFELTMAQTGILDEKTDSMVIKDSYIALTDGFKLSYDYNMTGYKAYTENALAMSTKKNPDPTDVFAMMNGLEINKMRIALKDDSIVERVFKLAAKEQGGTPSALKSQAKMGLAFLPMMAQDEAQQKIASELSAALGEWLEKSGTLVFDMNPSKPVNLGELMSGATSGDFDAGQLGLSITRE